MDFAESLAARDKELQAFSREISALRSAASRSPLACETTMSAGGMPAEGDDEAQVGRVLKEAAISQEGIAAHTKRDTGGISEERQEKDSAAVANDHEIEYARAAVVSVDEQVEAKEGDADQVVEMTVEVGSNHVDQEFEVVVVVEGQQQMQEETEGERSGKSKANDGGRKVGGNNQARDNDNGSSLFSPIMRSKWVSLVEGDDAPAQAGGGSEEISETIDAIIDRYTVRSMFVALNTFLRDSNYHSEIPYRLWFFVFVSKEMHSALC